MSSESHAGDDEARYSPGGGDETKTKISIYLRVRPSNGKSQAMYVEDDMRGVQISVPRSRDQG